MPAYPPFRCGIVLFDWRAAVCNVTPIQHSILKYDSVVMLHNVFSFLLVRMQQDNLLFYSSRSLSAVDNFYPVTLFNSLSLSLMT